MMKKTKLLLMACSLLIVASVNAQQRHELTVQEAVDLAFKNVIELKNATKEYLDTLTESNTLDFQTIVQNQLKV